MLLFGIAFQYFTTKPMRDEPPMRALADAFEADTLSLTAWQVGIYGWMAVATLAIFRQELRPTSIAFWLMMQTGVLAGFLTSYPVNWVLHRSPRPNAGLQRAGRHAQPRGARDSPFERRRSSAHAVGVEAAVAWCCVLCVLSDSARMARR